MSAKKFSTPSPNFRVYVKEAVETTPTIDTPRIKQSAVKLRTGHFSIGLQTDTRCEYDFWFTKNDGTKINMMYEGEYRGTGGTFDPVEADDHDVYQGPHWSDKRFTFGGNAINFFGKEDLPTTIQVDFYYDDPDEIVYRGETRGGLRGKGGVGLTGMQEHKVGTSVRPRLRKDNKVTYIINLIPA